MSCKFIDENLNKTKRRPCLKYVGLHDEELLCLKIILRECG